MKKEIIGYVKAKIRFPKGTITSKSMPQKEIKEKRIEGWEKEFDKNYYMLSIHTPEEIKDFIRQLLVQSKQKWVEENKKTSIWIRDGWGSGRKKCRFCGAEKINWAKDGVGTCP